MNLRKELKLQKELEEQREEILKRRDAANVELEEIEVRHDALERSREKKQRKIAILEGIKDRVLEEIGIRRKERDKRVKELENDEKKLAALVKIKNDELIELNRQIATVENKLFAQRNGIVKELKNIQDLQKKVESEKEKYAALQKMKKRLERDVNLAQYEYREAKDSTKERYSEVKKKEDQLIQREEAMVRREKDVQTLVARLKAICDKHQIQFNITL